MNTAIRGSKHGREDIKVALIGYGEVGRILAEDLRAAGHEVTAFDLGLLGNRDAKDQMRAHAQPRGVTLATSPEEAVAAADLVISAVTAQNTVAAAHSCAGALAAGAFFLDLNSASPGAKIMAAEIIGRANGRFVEGAVMAAVSAHRLRVPILLGGSYAPLMAPILERMGFDAQLCSINLGIASATMMCRSMLTKGLEALVVESLTAARHYGVEDGVLDCLSEIFPAIDWERQVTTFFQQAIEHGRSGGEELHEAAASVRDVGLEPWSAKASAARHDWMAALGDAGLFGAKGHAAFARSPGWRVEADRMLKALRRRARRMGDVPPAQKNIAISEGNAPRTTMP